MTNYNWDLSDDPWVTDRPSWLPSIEEYRTPREDWAAFTSQQQPFWSTRAPMADVGRNLQARYLLAAPQMGQQPSVPATFRRYLEDWPGTSPYRAQNVTALRARAQAAANAATQPAGPYLSQFTPGSPEWNQAAWLQGQFGMDAENAAANQLAVAQMLAVQRGEGLGGGGTVGNVYRGRMADAIRGAMQNLYQGRINVGAPRESFLDWYLQQTN
jgi:hypothetical protein